MMNVGRNVLRALALVAVGLFSFEAYSNISSNMDDGRVFDTLNGRINPFRVDYLTGVLILSESIRHPPHLKIIPNLPPCVL